MIIFGLIGGLGLALLVVLSLALPRLLRPDTSRHRLRLE